MQITADLKYIFAARSDFDIEVYKVTQSLITALAAVQQFNFSTQDRFISNMDVSIDIEGLNLEELNELTEQLIYRGWIISTIRAWESYRSQIAKQGFDPKMDIQKIQQRALGDLNKIRNSFIHGSGIVGQDRKCRIKDCKVLKWFDPGDKLIFTIMHVFDFLHHLCLLNAFQLKVKKSDTDLPDSQLVWLLKKGTISQPQGRKIISVEDSGITGGKPETRLLHILFDNGFFNVFKPENSSFRSVRIVEGNLEFDDGSIINAENLYKSLLKSFPPKVFWLQEWDIGPREKDILTLSSTFDIVISKAKITLIDIDN